MNPPSSPDGGSVKLPTKSERGIFERRITENDVLGACRELLKLNGADTDRIVERIPWGKTTSERGIPDLVCTFPKGCRTLKGSVLEPANALVATVCFVELKRPGGKLRPFQAIWLERKERLGAIAFKADSVEELVSEFAKRGIKIKGLP